MESGLTFRERLSLWWGGLTSIQKLRIVLYAVFALVVLGAGAKVCFTWNKMAGPVDCREEGKCDPPF